MRGLALAGSALRGFLLATAGRRITAPMSPTASMPQPPRTPPAPALVDRSRHV